MTRILRNLLLLLFLGMVSGCVVSTPTLVVSPTTVPLPTLPSEFVATPTQRVLRLSDFQTLKIGMSFEEVVAQVGEPDEKIAFSSAFATYAYYIESGETVYVYFYTQSDYLANVDYRSVTGEWKGFPLRHIHKPSPKPRELRQLHREDFKNIHVGMHYFEAYMFVGPYDTYLYFEDGVYAMIYYLSDGGRMGINVVHGVAGCISRIGYSPDAEGGNWIVVEEDTQGLCK